MCISGKCICGSHDKHVTYQVQLFLVNLCSTHFLPRVVLSARSLGLTAECGTGGVLAGEQRIQRTAAHILRTNLEGGSGADINRRAQYNA